jgi:hypothetical protein
MTCYFGKHDRIAVGAVILSKIPKIAFHDTNDYSLRVTLRSCLDPVAANSSYLIANIS